MEERVVITLVDDDLSVRRALSRLLQSAGYEVLTFSSAQELLDSRAGREADCFVLDIHLGAMNGFELDERLRATGCRRPVIFITAHDDEATRDRARRVRPDGYLRKPFEATALLEAIRAAVSETRAAS
jgi:FixJ family two-component response regulator